MSNYSEEQEKNLRRRLEILKEEMQAGRVMFAAHLAKETERSLLAVQYGRDGRIDLNTVDARTRALALAIVGVRDRREIKRQVSLADIQRAYFELVTQHFGEIADLAVERGLNPGRAARAAASDQNIVAQMSETIPRFMEVLSEFWDNLGEPAHVHLEDARYLKAVFGGDLFPSAYQNIGSTCGIYIDTIVLPDPFLRSAALFDVWSPERRAYFFIKHALNVLRYRELALRKWILRSL